MTLPTTETLLLEEKDQTLYIRLNRPDARNAMNLQMVHELMTTFAAVEPDRNIRAIVLRGAGGHFCAGGDIKDMANARAQLAKKATSGIDPFYDLNRQFGRLLSVVNQAPQVVITILEGAVLGGGFGLACVSDIAIAAKDAQFGLPETGLGIPPAQIAPFVVARIGLTQARRLALLGVRFNGETARNLGIVHEVADSPEAILTFLNDTLAQVRRCAPNANAITKRLLLATGQMPLETLLDQAAQDFSAAVTSAEGQEGTMAFIQKRRPKWAQTQEA
jgi:isohexenylglutaconyl-CoA hydratase